MRTPGPPKWDETVSEAEKGARLQAVIDLQERIAAEINADMVGGEVEVLVEGPARRREDWLAGKTPHFKTSVFPDCGVRVGEVVRVRVQNATDDTFQVRLARVDGMAGDVSGVSVHYLVVQAGVYPNMEGVRFESPRPRPPRWPRAARRR